MSENAIVEAATAVLNAAFPLSSRDGARFGIDVFEDGAVRFDVMTEDGLVCANLDPDEVRGIIAVLKHAVGDE